MIPFLIKYHIYIISYISYIYITLSDYTPGEGDGLDFPLELLVDHDQSLEAALHVLPPITHTHIHTVTRPPNIKPIYAYIYTQMTVHKHRHTQMRHLYTETQK